MTDEAAAVSREDEEDFDRYFDEFAGGESQEEQKDVDETDSQGQGGEENEDDQPSEADKLRAELEQIRKERDEFEHSFKSQVGRVSALQKKLDAIGEGKDEKKEDDKDIDDFEVVKEYDAELANAIDRRIENKVKQVRQEVEQRFEPIKQREEQDYIASQINELEKVHPKWRDTIATNEYAQWLNQLPVSVQNLMNSNDARDYAYLLDSFGKTQTNKNKEVADDLQQRRQQKLAANVAVQSKGPSKKAIAPDDFEAAWEYYAAKKK